MWFSDVYAFFKQLKVKYPDLNFCFYEIGLFAPHTYYIKTTIYKGNGRLAYIFDADTKEIKEEYM